MKHQKRISERPELELMEADIYSGVGVNPPHALAHIRYTRQVEQAAVLLRNALMMATEGVLDTEMSVLDIAEMIREVLASPIVMALPSSMDA